MEIIELPTDRGSEEPGEIYVLTDYARREDAPTFPFTPVGWTNALKVLKENPKYEMYVCPFPGSPEHRIFRMNERGKLFEP